MDIQKLKNNKSVYIILFSLALFFVVFIISYSRLTTQNVPVFSEKGADHGILNPINSFAKRSCVNKGRTAFYNFTDVQKILIQNTYKESNNVSVVFRLTVKFPSSAKKLSGLEAVENIPVQIGFLDSNDFDKKGKLNFSLENHKLVSCNMVHVLEPEKKIKTFDVSFAIPCDKLSNVLESKEGIFIQSELTLWLQNIIISPAVIGFDISREIPFYGFSSNGGNLDFDITSFDFTGSSNIFPVLYSPSSIMPEYTLKLKSDENPEASFSFGGENITIKRLEEYHLSTLALKNPFSNMVLKNHSENVKAVLLGINRDSVSDESLGNNGPYVVNPIKTDPGLITGWPQENWRFPEYELFEWDRNPNVLFFDTKNYSVQSKFFGRIAFFIEKEGYKGKLLTNEELEGKHDYNAHDYSAESFEKFFNKAFRLNFRLNPEEELLLEILVRNNILERTTDPLNPYISKGGAVLSISRQIPYYNRVSLLAHEGWHTLYFIDPDFRDYVSVVYNIFDPSSKQFLTDYFKSQPSLGYDTNDEYLMQNEFMAYILQHKEGQAGEYFVKRASWPSVKKVTPNLCNYINETAGSGFDDCLLMLQDFVFDKYKLKSGNIGLCSY